jgi:hypothetical protein
MGGAEMTVAVNLKSQIGVELAGRLGLQLNRREGHDLAGACIACKSSDAFRLHQQTGVGHCYSCQGKWSPFQVAQTVLRDRERAKALLVEMGVYQPTANHSTPVTDAITAISRQKEITPESLRAFGAQATCCAGLAGANRSCRQSPMLGSRMGGESIQAAMARRQPLPPLKYRFPRATPSSSMCHRQVGNRSALSWRSVAR